jgi:hypothetical protein
MFLHHQSRNPHHHRRKNIMCGAAAIPVITAIISAGAQVYSEKQKSDIETRVAGNNRANALKAERDSLDAQGAQANQEHDLATQQATNNAINAARARANVSATANEQGTGGYSIDALMGDVDRQEAKNYESLAANEQYAADQRYRQNQGIVNTAQSRINAVQPGNFNSAIGAIQIVGAGASAAAQSYGH